MTATSRVGANVFQTATCIHQANGSEVFRCVSTSAEHIRVLPSRSEQKLLEWQDFNGFSKLARAEPQTGCGKINGTAKLAVSQFLLQLLQFWLPVVGKRVQQIRHLACIFFPCQQW